MILIVGLGNPGIEYHNTRHNIGFIALDSLADNLFSSNWIYKKKFNADVSTPYLHSVNTAKSNPTSITNNNLYSTDSTKLHPASNLHADPSANLHSVHNTSFQSTNSTNSHSITANTDSGNNINKIHSADTTNLAVTLLKPMSFVNLSGNSILAFAAYYKISPKNIIVIYDDVDLPLGTIKYKMSGSHAGHNGLKSIDTKIGKDYHRIRIGIGKPSHPNYDLANYVLAKLPKNELTILDQKLQSLQNAMKIFLPDMDEKNNIELFKNTLANISKE